VHHHSATAEHHWQGWYFGRWTDLAKPSQDPLITEFGAQALPVLQSLRRIVPLQTGWPPTGAQWAEWEYHNFQRHETFEMAGIAQGASLEEFIRNSQRYQARSIQLAAESYRRQRFQPVAAIFQFMFVEGWPSINWGIVDYWRNPKPGYNALSTAYQPVLPSIEWSRERFEPGEQIRFGLWAINDRWERLADVSYRYGITGTHGEFVFSRTERLDIEADSVRKVADISELTLDAGSYAVEAVISEPSGVVLGANRFEFDVAPCGDCKP
jgi:beta-mannosidase